MIRKVLFAGLIGAVAVSGCSSSSNVKPNKRNPAPCPNVVVLQDAARVIEFAGEFSEIEEVAFTGEIETVRLSCRYYEDRPIEASLEIDLALGRGPAADRDRHEFSYFVAVTRTNTEVIAKEVFPVSVEFSGDRSVRRVKEKVAKIQIPRKAASISGTNFEVIVGFVVTPAQATYNRSGKSLKFPEL